MNKTATITTSFNNTRVTDDLLWISIEVIYLHKKKHANTQIGGRNKYTYFSDGSASVSDINTNKLINNYKKEKN